MGDYSFFIKSASFLIILNAAILSFPEGIETITGGNLNTSEITGTSVNIEDPTIGSVSQAANVSLGSSLASKNVGLSQDGSLILQGDKSNGFATYDLTKFPTNSDGNRAFYIEASTPLFSFDPLSVEVAFDDPALGNKVFNRTVREPELFTKVTGNNLTVYLNNQKTVVESIENSVGVQHPQDKGVVERVSDGLGISDFTDTLRQLVSLYTTPSSGNQVLGAIFTLYLLGFTVFLLKEVVPG